VDIASSNLPTSVVASSLQPSPRAHDVHMAMHLPLQHCLAATHLALLIRPLQPPDHRHDLVVRHQKGDFFWIGRERRVHHRLSVLVVRRSIVCYGTEVEAETSVHRCLQKRVKEYLDSHWKRAANWRCQQTLKSLRISVTCGIWTRGRGKL
jgi:hypothetical protein